MDILYLIPESHMMDCQNFDMKILSWSEIISTGQPFSQYHHLKNTPVISLALLSIQQGMI